MAETLADRVARLEAFEAMRTLKERYAQIADAKYTSAHQRVDGEAWVRTANEQAACFTVDARWFGGSEFGGVIEGRDALAQWFTRSPWRFAMHYYVSPHLTLTADDEGEGRWRLWQIGLPLDESPPVLLFATTREAYRRVDGRWLISTMQFKEIQQLSLADAPAILACTLQREMR